jgi:uncharacterized membrane protein YbhN (UPF0104 family)
MIMIKTILKIIFAAALLFWLVSSGKLDFSLIRKSFQVGPQWIIALVLIFIQILLAAYRYKLLLETKSHKPLRFFEIFRLNYIGLFFSSVLPGAVTGDIIKLVYIKKLSPKFNKTFLITITLLDRIMGLTGLLFLAGAFSLMYYGEVTALSPMLAHVIKLNLLLFAGAVAFLAVLVSPAAFQNKILRLTKSVPVIGKKIEKILHQIFALRENRIDVLKSFLLGTIGQFFSILAFWIVASPFMEKSLPFHFAFTFIPVGLITMAIPISPGGLGVGHVLFAKLFSLTGIENGASLFNLFYLCNLVNNAIGVIPYLTISRNKIKADPE